MRYLELINVTNGDTSILTLSELLDLINERSPSKYDETDWQDGLIWTNYLFLKEIYVQDTSNECMAI